MKELSCNKSLLEYFNNVVKVIKVKKSNTTVVYMYSNLYEIICIHKMCLGKK